MQGVKEVLVIVVNNSLANVSGGLDIEQTFALKKESFHVLFLLSPCLPTPCRASSFFEKSFSLTYFAPCGLLLCIFMESRASIERQPSSKP